MGRKLISAQEWLRLRKKTVLAHWLYGLFCAIVAWQFFPAGITLLLIFAGWEMWNDVNEKKRQSTYKPEGDLDFWDALVVKISSFAIIVVLHIIGVLTIRWY
jgi:hypothetical protein